MTHAIHLDWVTSTRSALHQIPELGFDCYLTAAFIEKELKSYGYTPIRMAKTGVVALKAGKSTDALGIRSDMDALPIVEKSGHPTPSLHPGCMHACGHDGHMTMVLAVAKELSSLPPLPYTIVFIFQPAEEGPGGAKTMIDEGLISRFNLKAILGLHLFPQLPEGTFGGKPGAMMALNGEIDVEFLGKSAHAGQPHLGHDALLASAHYLSSVQTILSRNVPPLDTAIINFGTIQGGQARNAISDYVKTTGTIRAFDIQTYNMIKQRLNEIAQGIKTSLQVSVNTEIRDFYPPVINDLSLFEQSKEWMKNITFESIDPLMLSEDFSFYQQEIPGLFLMLGTRNEEKNFIYPLHHDQFNFDEKVLLKGISFLIEACKHYKG